MQSRNIDKITTPGNSRYYYLENADGKYWMLPKQHLTIGMELYQPSGRNGRLLKKLFPLLHHLSVVRRAVHAEEMNLTLKKEIMEKAREAFDVNDLEFSIFGGTPSVHQKVTIQFFKDDKILGYGKVTSNGDIAGLFTHEQRLLDELKTVGILDIPRCLYCGKLSSGQYLFLQSTTKTRSSHSPSSLTPLHKEFLTHLYSDTKREMLFDDTDFGRSLTALKDNIDIIPDTFKDNIRKSLDRTIDELRGQRVEYSAFHADFTPWNMFINDRQLFVFDWEYGRMTYPPMLDLYHFIVQQAFHVDHLNAAQTLLRLKETDFYSSVGLRYYLLDIISRFTLRENGAISSSLYSSLQYWSELLWIMD